MPIRSPLSLLAATSLALASLASPRSALAWTPPGAAASGLNTLGAPAIDFSPGGGAQPEAAVYVWVDSAGVTHFTDQTGEYLARYRDRFQPVDLFVNSVGQPKR